MSGLDVTLQNCKRNRRKDGGTFSQGPCTFPQSSASLGHAGQTFPQAAFASCGRTTDSSSCSWACLSDCRLPAPAGWETGSPASQMFFSQIHSHLTSKQISDSNGQGLDSSPSQRASEGQEAAWHDAKDLELGVQILAPPFTDGRAWINALTSESQFVCSPNSH